MRLGPDFQFSRILVPDVMHEFELGVWKALFIHLVRVTMAVGKKTDANLVDELNSW